MKSTRIFLGILALFFTLSSFAQTEIADSEVADLVLTAWKTPPCVTSLPFKGAYSVVRGKGDWKNGQISRDTFKKLQILDSHDLVTVTLDQEYERYKKGEDFSWDNWLQQTQRGTVAKVVITPTEAGRKYRNREQSNLISVPCADETEITAVVKNEHIKRGIRDYRVVMIRYTNDWNPVFKSLSKSELSTQRKAIVLFEWDAFESEWRGVAVDYANNDEQFDTNRVSNTLQR